MRKLGYLLFLIGYLFSFKIVLANDIKSISMDIYIDNYGNAQVTEEWIAYVNSGTEGYKPYYNLGASEIKDYKVYLNKEEFNTLDYWDIDASFNSKAYKAGINEINDGYELCFGISEYGNNTYTLKYTITNFVSEIEDADMVYWQLVPHDLSDKPEYVYIKIHSDFKYDFSLPVWGYGNYGNYVYVTEDTGIIEYIAEDGLDSDEYMTILVKFPKGTFSLTNELSNDFDYYLDMAEDGATTYSDETSFIGNFFNIILRIVLFFINFIPFIIAVIVILLTANSSAYGTKKLKFSKDAKKFNDVPYFRDIPCNKNIFKAYWVACQYGLVKNKTDFLGTILLKWIKNKNVENIKTESGLLKKETRAIKLVNTDGLSDTELELYNMMEKASLDGTLESKEFEKWCKKNYSKILNWFNKVIDDETMKFVNEGLIVEEKKTFGNIYHVSDTMKNIAIDMYGLKKFLDEFSNIKDRESIEVNLWDEYLMYAQIFGIAKKVAKEFKELYPDVITEEVYDDFIFIHTISFSGVSAATTARDRARSYSSGGGGFSSGGGGGGSFGGGGGGGGFR